jgi:16S rRNA processing protein RimM
MQKKMGYMKLDGIDHIDQTEQLIDQEVFMKRDDIELDDDEYLITELIGLRVETDTGEDLGLVRDILSHSGNDILVVQGEQEVLIPMVDEFVKDISLQQHKVVVSLIEGM